MGPPRRWSELPRHANVSSKRTLMDDALKTNVPVRPISAASPTSAEAAMSIIPESAKPPDATVHRAVSGSSAAAGEVQQDGRYECVTAYWSIDCARRASAHRAAATKAPAGRTAVLAFQTTLDRLANTTVRTAKAMLPAFLPVMRGLQPMPSQSELEQASGAVLRNPRRSEHRGEKWNTLARTVGATTWCEGR